MFIPAVDAFGVRRTVNANLTSAQTVWNFRSAMNVAALNCLRPGDDPILTAYADMLKTHAQALSATNRALDSEFRQRYGATYRTVRDEYMTQVYNYFALPPVLGQMCDTALAVSQEYLQAPPSDFGIFAASALPRFETSYLAFFGNYERWRKDAAAWDVRYGARYGHIFPAYIEAERRRQQAAAALGIQTPMVLGRRAVVQVPQRGATAPGQPLPDASVSYGVSSAPVSTAIEPAPQPGLSVPVRAREGASAVVSQPVVQSLPASGDTSE